MATTNLAPQQIHKLLADSCADFTPDDFEKLSMLGVPEYRCGSDLAQIKAVMNTLEMTDCKEDCGICLNAPQTHIIPCSKRHVFCDL